MRCCAINAGVVILVGSLARPLGGFLFGGYGDHRGRKKAFTLTVLLMPIPTVLIGITPGFSEWSLYAIIFLGIMKFLQGIPAGGEVPGAICYLAESSAKGKERYTCSWALVGPQIGLLLALAECQLLQVLLSNEALMTWGWRLSFLTAGLLGIVGFFLRKKLHETENYSKSKREHQVIEHPIIEVRKRHKVEVVMGFCVTIFEVVAFCLLTIVPVYYFENTFGITDGQNLAISTLTLSFCAILPPIIGKLANRYQKIPLLEISAYGFIPLAAVFYWSIANHNLVVALVMQAGLVLFFSIQVALIPFVLASLFPTPIRYTGIGVSFNICDGVLWGLIPILSALLIQKTGRPESFVILMPVSAIIFLFSYHFTKKHMSKTKYIQ